MDSAELLRRLKRIAKQRGVPYAFDPRPGKGSHGRVTLGTHFTTVPTHGDIGKGLLHAILRDLGLNRDDL